MRITILTPTLNQGAFIERTLRSVLSQSGDFELEYLVLDGGSTDGTLEVLRRYEGRVRWLSAPDRGQSDALNKGFRMATGEVVAWINSDDVYAPGALDAVARSLGAGPARWCFGDCAIIDEHDREIRRAVSGYKRWVARRYSLRRLLGRNFIPQPATFFRRDLLLEVGPLDESLHYAMDYDLWLRFARLGAPAYLPQRLASFRWHGGSKTAARYRRGAWECFQIAQRRARGLEKAALGQHLAHYAAQVAVYRMLDAARSGRGGGS